MGFAVLKSGISEICVNQGRCNGICTSGVCFQFTTVSMMRAVVTMEIVAVMAMAVPVTMDGISNQIVQVILAFLCYVLLYCLGLVQ